MRLLLSVDDLTDDEVRKVLDRAHALAAGATPRQVSPVVGLLFLSESTRTLVGFSVAAARLGGSSTAVSQTRDGAAMSAAESFEDTVRTLTGMVDLLVVRTSQELDRDVLANCARAPVLSGGHGSDEHPTQALIDVLAIEAECGPVSQQHVVVCGDLTMRGTRSLLKVFRRTPPRRLTLVAPAGRDDHSVDLGALSSRCTASRTLEDVADADVLYLPGLPAKRGGHQLDNAARRCFAATPEVMSLLPDHAVVLCPLPAIDEVDPIVRDDRRIRMFEQSDRAVLLRVALLEHLLA